MALSLTEACMMHLWESAVWNKSTGTLKSRKGVSGKIGILVTTGHIQYADSCRHMHTVAAVPAEAQLCLESALLSDMDALLSIKAQRNRSPKPHTIVKRHWFVSVCVKGVI